MADDEEMVHKVLERMQAEKIHLENDINKLLAQFTKKWGG